MSTSSISDKQRRALVRFYRREIQSRAPEPGALERDADPERESYYVRRELAPLTRRDFEIPLADRDQIAATLDAHWERGPLRGLGLRIARLSRRFPNVREKSDVSSFIYEMF